MINYNSFDETRFQRSKTFHRYSYIRSSNTDCSIKVMFLADIISKLFVKEYVLHECILKPYSMTTIGGEKDATGL